MRASASSRRSGTRAAPCHVGGGGDLAEQEPLDGAPEELRARDLPARTRPAVERALQLPRGAVQPAECSVERRRVARRGRPARIASAASRDETKHSYIPSPDTGSIRPAASPTRSARSPASARLAPAQRQAVAAQLVELRRVEPVRLADAREVLADPRPFVLPRADADVHVVALREDPAVAARDVGELDDRAARVALARDDAVARRSPRRRRRARSRRRDRAPSPSCRSRRRRRRRSRPARSSRRSSCPRAPPPRARAPRRAGTRRAGGAASSGSPASGAWRTTVSP